jgi:hypothetical protein
VRVEIMGPVNYENVGESQAVLIMIDPIISTRTRSWLRSRSPPSSVRVHEVAQLVRDDGRAPPPGP